ncbi:MAG: proton-conducting membrane transporter [Eubacterium sp.]|nr:proton-conducting membrane transporter [Eubacterium sp.]
MYLILLSILIPVLSGLFLLITRRTPLNGETAKGNPTDRRTLLITTSAALLLTDLLTCAALIGAYGSSYTLFALTDKLSVVFGVDEPCVLFASVAMLVMTCAGFFSYEYMKREQREGRYYGFYLIVFGILNALCFAGNLITFYLFFELLTLSSVPLVLHNGSREAVMAGLKYLFYSLCGAYLALFGIYFVYRYGDTLTFTAGGVLQDVDPSATGILLLVAMLMLLGFGVKAGMFPLHAWLPAAHPVAPAPASAVLSAVIVKAGVLAVLRTVYYIFGASFLRGTWVQTAWLSLTLITVFMGSLLAYREPVLKKRLAYSTVSQLSYILFGLAVMDVSAVNGSLLHVLAHALIKATLFLCAGAIIYTTGRTRVEELRGIGKEMPLTLWCYTIVSLGLIGIPPTGGFISKWYLAMGSLYSAMPIFRWLGPAVLLLSALLTAGYLLPLTIHGFLPGDDYDYAHLTKREPSLLMTIPVVIMTVLSVLIGLFPTALVDFLTRFVSQLV